MVKTFSIDPTTLVLKADSENELNPIMDMISSQKEKRNAVEDFLRLASQNRIIDNAFKFNRDECYER